MSKRRSNRQPQPQQLQNTQLQTQLAETAVTEVKQQNTEVSELPQEDGVAVDTRQTEYTPEQIGQIVDELAATPKRTRVWEVDFLRGFMILFVVWDHLMWDLRNWGPYKSDFFNSLYLFASDYFGGVLRATTHDTFVSLFVLTSGVSCSFSRSNGKRAIKMVSFALLLTAVTYALSSIFNQNVTMYFNVIHVIALSVLMWTAIEWVWNKCVKNWHKNIFGVAMFIVTVTALLVGYCAKTQPWTNENPAFFFLAMHNTNVSGFTKFWGGDYLPFLPDFGWFLIGAFLGRCLYRERKSLFPSVNEKWVCPVTFCGRHSIWIYFGSQVLMAGILLLLKEVIHCI
ncbi:MAG: DUF1624 domain-containing protein [Corallococcus sp.]|nr:DUF1624 domain-containing protein [Corallococcus sp.]MCM1359410.1 DUF1624 domain-containing protein [Corallococcus sp.]MCM1394853.1 DUF1624 domain-containing protein [Corallococcus sp.]